MLRFIILLLINSIFVAQAFAGGKKNEDERCDRVIQMGIMNNLVTTGKLHEEFPDLPKTSVDFITTDFERAKDLVEKARASGKAPPMNIISQVVERSDVTQPVKGKRFPVEGKSDISKNTNYGAKKMAIEEEKAAYALSDMGYKVKFNDGNITKERMIKEGLNPNRMPDLEVNGKIFDIYTPQSVNPISAAEGVIDKVQKGQTHRVVLNASEGYNSTEKLQALSKELRSRNPEGLHEVIAIQNNNGVTEMVRVFP